MCLHFWTSSFPVFWRIFADVCLDPLDRKYTQRKASAYKGQYKKKKKKTWDCALRGTQTHDLRARELDTIQLTVISRHTTIYEKFTVNIVIPELNPICYLLALLGAHHFLHVNRIRVKLLTFMQLMSYIYIYIYIYGAPILDISRSHTTTQHSR